jgi:hypothetical protein
LAFLENKCTFKVYNQDIIDYCNDFDCGHDDLNDFFRNDAIKYSADLLGKSYCFTLDENPKEIVCAFTISNDSIKVFQMPNSRKKIVNKNISIHKRMKSYPAVLVGRLGVNKKYRQIKGYKNRIGDELMNFIKSWFIDKHNKTGCRFVIVDSYNEIIPLKYYMRNGFKSIFSTEEQEKEYTNTPIEKKLNTRLLFFDLILLSS